MNKDTKIILIVVVVFVIGIIVAAVSYENNKKNLANIDTTNTQATSGQFTTNTNQEYTNIEINNTDKNMNNQNETSYTKAILHTNMGDISFEFSKDKPLTTSNFIKLAREGFYNGIKFHRVIENFMIQAGDPLSKDEAQKAFWGTGGPGYKFNDELTGEEKYEIGTVAMANSGPNTNGSQFFIMTSNTPLPPSYTIFGKVVDGQDIAQKIQGVETDSKDRPVENIIINSVELK